MKSPLPQPHADATVTLNLSQVHFCHVHSQGGHSVFVFTLAIVTAELTHSCPPRDTDCDSLCITLEPYMVEGREGSGLRQGPSVVHCLTANSASVCLCMFMDELWSESHFDDFSSFFSLSLCTPLPLLFHRWPTIGRTRTSERTTELHEEHLQSTTLEKKRLHWRTRETTRWDTSTPP